MAGEKVKFETSLGSMTIELYEDKSPETVGNFLKYVKEGFYDGTIFHRIIPGFVVQGGGMLPGLKEKATHSPIRNEASNGLSNGRGTLSMARTSDPHSATSQFFINLVDNNRLDHSGPTPQGWGYCVFGKVTEGIDVIDLMAKVETGTKPPHSDVPVKDVVLVRASVVQ